jgi:signal transduction histidine kinase
MMLRMATRSWAASSRAAEAAATVGALAAALYAVSVPAAVHELERVDAPGLAALGLSPRGYALYVVVLVSALAVVYLTVAGLLLRLAARRAASVSSALVLICLGVVFPQTLPALAAVHPGWSVAVDVLERGAVVALTVWVLTFPDGRFRPRWTAALAGLVAVGEVAGFAGLLPEGDAVALALDAAWAVALVLVVAWRYRALGSADSRAGVRRVAAATAVALAALVLAAIAQGPLGAVPGTVADLVVQAGIVLAFMLVPAAVAVALLRHRMWGVEASVARAVTYGALTAAAIGAYVVVVAASTRALPLDATATATVAAGLLALAVHPVYLRLRRVVDGLFYGDRARAVAGLTSLGGAPASGTDVVRSVAELLLRTLRLRYVAVAVGEPGEEAERGAAGSPADGWPTDVVELHHLGARVGTLTLARRDRDGPVAETDRRAVTDVARELSVLASSLLLTERLRESQRRLVTAREEERRRLRNDLHDGLGPALGAVLLTLAAAENRLAASAPDVSALLAEAREQTAAAVSDVRRLVYGLRPPALDELALDGAVRAVLAKLGAAGCSFHLSVSGDLSDLPAAVEVAAYRIMTEAATNVVRHAGARQCSVAVERSDAALSVSVVDDGVGTAGAVGVGVASMRERAGELGGSLSISRGTAGGTVVRAVLPLAAAEAVHG